MTYIKFLSIFSYLLQYCVSYTISSSDHVISPIGYLEKDSDQDSPALVIPTSSYVIDDTSKLEVITDADDTEQPTKIANYDYSMNYVAVVYEGKQYMVAIPTDDIEDLDDQERAEIAMSVHQEDATEKKKEIEEYENDRDDALEMFSYIYTVDQAINSTGSSSEENATNSNDEAVSTLQISKEELEVSLNSHSFFEYFSRKFLA